MDSTYTTHATYNVGDAIQVSTIVPAGTDPVSIQGFRDGTPGNVLSWNVAETGYDYIIGGGPATAIGTHTDYTRVTFADGSVIQSNNISITVQSTGATRPVASPVLSGCQGDVGVGIVVGTPSGVASNVSISQDTVVNYQKAGILCWEKGTSCTLSNNTISPLATSESTNAPNGVEFMFGAAGSIAANTIGANICGIPGVCGSGLVSQQQSCGIMTFEASSGVDITSNQLSRDDIGVCLGGDLGTVTTSSNHVNESTYAGVEVYDESQMVMGNTISNSQYGIVPISDLSHYPARVGYADAFTSVTTDCYPIAVITGVATCTLASSSIGMGM